MTMDYSPWSEREIWLFLRVAVSSKLEVLHPPKSVYMHVTSTHDCMNFLSRFRLIQFFDDHGHSPWLEREIWPFLRVAVSSKPEVLRPPKLVYMYGTSTHVCMNFLSRFQSIQFFDDHGL